MEYEEGRFEEEGERGEEEDDEPLPPPPPEEEKELLFLIEFLVDTLTVNPKNMKLENMDPCLLQGQNCIELTFLHYPPMCICEKDIDSCKLTGENVTRFNCGKSLMFALTEDQFEEPPPIFLGVNVHKQLPHGISPSKLMVGKTRIALSDLFKHVFEKYDEKPEKLPLSKSMKNSFELVGEKKKVSGEISIYIRLTCLGQNVVTEFQRGEDEMEPIRFKNKESVKIYECKQTVKSDEELARPCPGWGEAVPGRKGKGCPDKPFFSRNRKR